MIEYKNAMFEALNQIVKGFQIPRRSKMPKPKYKECKIRHGTEFGQISM